MKKPPKVIWVCGARDPLTEEYALCEREPRGTDCDACRADAVEQEDEDGQHCPGPVKYERAEEKK